MHSSSNGNNRLLPFDPILPLLSCLQLLLHSPFISNITFTICYSFLAGAFLFPFCIVNEKIAKLLSQTEQVPLFLELKRIALLTGCQIIQWWWQKMKPLILWDMNVIRQTYDPIPFCMEDGNQWMDINLYLQDASGITFLYLLHFPFTFYHWTWTYAWMFPTTNYKEMMVEVGSFYSNAGIISHTSVAMPMVLSGWMI